MALHKAHRETDEQSESNAANCHPDESKRRITDRESSRHQSGNRKLQRHQCGRIVHQTFALQNCFYAVRHGKPANHARRRDRVRRGDDCPERERRSPGQTRHNGMGHARNRDGREEDQSDSEQQNWPQVAPEIAP